MARYLLLLTVLTAAYLPITATATPAGTVDTVTPAAPYQFIHDAEQRRDDFEQEQRQRQLLQDQPKPTPAQPPEHTPDEGPDAPCWYVTGVRISGNRLVTIATLYQAIEPHLSPCLGPGRINRLLAAITQAYATAGYVASRPVLTAPPEDGKPLAIALEEGFVESIELTDSELPVNLSAAFPGVIGRPLHLRRLEQGLDQLNRLRSVDLTMEIVPGTLQGGSRVVLHPLSRPSRWELTGGIDNAGSASTGHQRKSLSLAVDSPLERNDLLTLYAMASDAEVDAGSKTLGLNYGVPYGPWTLSAGVNYFRYQSVADGYRGKIDYRGTSTLFSAALERALWRDQQRLVSATLRWEGKHAENQAQRQRLAVQSPRYESLEVGLNGLWLGTATWAGYLGYSQGLGGWSANDGRAFKQPNAQTARYGKWRATLSRSMTFQWSGLNWTHVSSLQGQYSAQPMPPLDHLSLAGGNYVRGFQTGGASAQSGVAWQNSLYLPFALRPRLSLTPSLGLDAGWADGRGPGQGERLLGAAIGLSLTHPPCATLSAHYQRSLYRRVRPLEPGYWRLSLQLRL